MNESLAQKIFFGLLLLAVSAAFVWLIRGFLQPIFWAVALGIVFYPLHSKILRLTGERQSLAAGISLILVLLLAILPLVGVTAAVAQEATQLYERVRSGDIAITGILDWLTLKVPVVSTALESLGFEIDKIKAQLSTVVLRSGQFVTSSIVALGQNTVRFAVMFSIMLYLLFFMMRDGKQIIEAVIHASPLGDEKEHELLDRFAAVSRATIKGTLVIGLVQGMIGGVAFALMGLTSPVLWGVVMALLSIVPAVGPALVWVPAAILLFVNGQIAMGVIMVIVGVVFIGLADNLLRPLLVGRDTQMPDYLILLSTLGGLVAFGLAGVVIGPIIAAFFITIWGMAADEYGDRDTPDDQGNSER